MGCGDCQKTIDKLESRVRDLEAVLEDLKAEYLALAKDFDELAAKAPYGEESEDE